MSAFHVPWETGSFQDRYVDVKGIRTRYWQMGESGPPVILVHGLGASVEYWVRNVAAFAGHFRVYAVDIVGFGRTDKPPGFDYSFDNVADFMAAFLDAVGLDSVHWVGNSMGGLVVMVTATRHPERTRSVALVDAAGFGRQVTWLFRVMSIPMMGEVMLNLGTHGMRYLMRHLFANPAEVPSSWVSALVDIMRPPDTRRAFLKVLRSGVDLWGVKRHVVEIVPRLMDLYDFPTLVLWGRQDRILPFKQGLNALAKIPGAQLHVWDGAGHLPMLEKAASFNGVVLNWLDEASSLPPVPRAPVVATNGDLSSSIPQPSQGAESWPSPKSW